MALFKCTECSGQVSDKAKSCPHCGAPTKTKCSECGTYESTDKKYCSVCGAPFDEIPDSLEAKLSMGNSIKDDVSYPKIGNVNDHNHVKKKSRKSIVFLITIASIFSLIFVCIFETADARKLRHALKGTHWFLTYPGSDTYAYLLEFDEGGDLSIYQGGYKLAECYRIGHLNKFNTKNRTFVLHTLYGDIGKRNDVYLNVSYLLGYSLSNDKITKIWIKKSLD
ncbi:MAG: zinc ribbon domain-containing protein [Candidatus Electryonea clarkiae]|nr:zinc ribbon domain-containing protein [Candidatus Electryonea clarkiae]MDP8288796.1 zinc ribbon domain-containing protein [Candidatus Electryonea clarkiae]